LDITAAFASVVKERLVKTMKGKEINRDLVRLTESFWRGRIVEIVLSGNALGTQPVEAGIPQRSLASRVHFAITTVGLIQQAEWKVEGTGVGVGVRVRVRVVVGVEGLSSMDHLRWIVSGRDVNQKTRKLKW
jgi:hypothetical protein